MPRTTLTRTLPVAYDDALEVIAADPPRLLRDATDRLTADGDAVVRTLTCEVAGFHLARDVVVEVEPMIPAQVLRATVPLRWRAASGAGWFPTVTATLDVAATPGDPTATTLVLHADHRPPFGAAGALLDRTLARHLSATVLAGLLDAIAARVVTLVDTIDLSSDLREVAPLPAPVDVRAATPFAPDAPVAEVLHADATQRVQLVGMEPWQVRTLDATDATVTLTVLGGRGVLRRHGAEVTLAAGQVQIVPAGTDANFTAAGQRTTVLESVVPVEAGLAVVTEGTLVTTA